MAQRPVTCQDGSADVETLKRFSSDQAYRTLTSIALHNPLFRQSDRLALDHLHRAQRLRLQFRRHLFESRSAHRHLAWVLRRTPGGRIVGRLLLGHVGRRMGHGHLCLAGDTRQRRRWRHGRTAEEARRRRGIRAGRGQAKGTAAAARHAAAATHQKRACRT